MSRKPFKIENFSIKNGDINFTEEDLEKIRMIFVGTLIQHHYLKHKNIDITTTSIRFNLVECGREFVSLLNENMKNYHYEFTLLDLFKLCNQMLIITNEQSSEEI